MAPLDKQQDDMEMDTFEEDNTAVHTPPAHIAARFYNRRSASRRKSSATSSRRSSISSSRHSHHSTISAHGGPQSTHIAQHMRRASIIESRKARLADRAAHAEQVRLRAAIAKSMPRASFREERALAAHAAREKLLAEITAKCEEEVRRAKKVAEETKEKRAAELARLKEDMAEKLAEAARRRLAYQQASRRPRTMSSPSTDDRKDTREHLRRLQETYAAKLIQRSWRESRGRDIISQFSQLGVSQARITEMPFESVGALVADEHVISISAALLKSVGLLNHTSQLAEDRGTVRVFLSSYMISCHPTATLSHGGKDDLEQDLIGKADAFLSAFERFLSIGSSGAPLLDSSNGGKNQLLTLFNDFSSVFHSWKSNDSNALIEIMVNQFVELDLILQATKDDQSGGVAQDYEEAVRTNQVQLLARLKRLAGPETAMSLIKAAVKKARKQRLRKQRPMTEDNTPRALSDSEPDLMLAESKDVKKADQTSSARSPTDQSSIGSRLNATMTVLPSNRIISHEIQVNGMFEVQQQPWTESRKQYFNLLQTSMRASMSNGDTAAAASWTFAMAKMIRERIMSFLSQRHPLHQRIDGFLDLQLIDQTCRNGMFSYADFFRTIASFLAQLCSPGRDEIVKKFSEDTTCDTIERLFMLINIIDLMALDHINFAFRMSAASVIEHGHKHEHESFEKDTIEGRCSLNATRAFWNRARTRIEEDDLRRSISTTNLGNTIYIRGLVDLVLENIHLSHSDIPETLHLDWQRVVDLRARIFKIVATASTLLTSKIRLRRNRESQWAQDAERVMNIDWSSVDAARIVSLIESSHMMPSSTRDGLLDFVRRVLPPAATAAKNAAAVEKARVATLQQTSMLSSVFSGPAKMETDDGDFFTEQVATFVLKSLREHIFARMSAVSTAEKARVTSTASEALARAGMPEFSADVTSIIETLERVKRVDLRSHEKWYEEIAKEPQA